MAAFENTMRNILNIGLSLIVGRIEELYNKFMTMPHGQRFDILAEARYLYNEHADEFSLRDDLRLSRMITEMKNAL